MRKALPHGLLFFIQLTFQGEAVPSHEARGQLHVNAHQDADDIGNEAENRQDGCGRRVAGEPVDHAHGPSSFVLTGDGHAEADPGNDEPQVAGYERSLEVPEARQNLREQLSP